MVYTFLMWIILGALLSFSVLALEPFERITNVKILRVLPDNTLMLNRGLEDGILRNDHIKLSSSTEGFRARAICLRAAPTVSYWRLYRVPHADAFSLDNEYIIIGLADREIPDKMGKLRDSRQEIEGLEDKVVKDPGPNPFTVNRDLPERLTERDLIKATGPDKRKLFIEKTLNQDLLERDLRDYQFSVYASPFTKQSINEGESLVYGFRGGNIGSKYRLLTQFEQQQTKLKDPLTNETVSTRSTAGNAQFIIGHISPSISSLSLINYNSQRFSALATPKSHWQVGVIGFTWHIYESKTWEFMDLSYVPLFDVRQTEVITSTGKTDIVEKNGLRHGFRLGFRTRINERVALENLLWVRPFQDLSTWEIAGDDLNLVNDLKFVFSLTDRLFFDYNFIYQKDKLWATLSNLPENNVINSVNLRYDFNL